MGPRLQPFPGVLKAPKSTINLVFGGAFELHYDSMAVIGGLNKPD